MLMQRVDNWGQWILIPSKDEWEEMTSTSSRAYLGYDLSEMICDEATKDLRDFDAYPEIILGLVDLPGRYNYLRLLELEGLLHRVQFENVICEHCDKRSGMSATPSYSSYSGARKQKEAWDFVMSLSVKSCIHCGGLLHRRHTLWLSPD
jgi:hypothetical protein